MGEQAYSFSLTTFSPSGKLVQIEYALNAVNSGSSSIGIKAKDGVVLATEKKAPTLMDETTLQKINPISDNIGVVYSGMGPDSRVLLRKGRKISMNYNLYYQDAVPVQECVHRLAAVMQDYTQSGGVRPFGCSLLLAGIDERGPQLYQIDPSGSYWAWKASAIGKNYANAKTDLEKRYNDEMEVEDAIHTALFTLKKGFEGEMTEKNVELGVIDAKTKTFRVLTQAELKDYLNEIE